MAKVNINKENSVLFMIDAQNDFISGSLKVDGAIAIMPTINKYISKSKFIIATQDWHPDNHISFVPQGGPFPLHCVRDTWGAQIHESIDQSKHMFYIKKGDIQFKEEFSAFGNQFLNTLLDHMESSPYVDHSELFCGLATEYCDKAHVMDALVRAKEKTTEYHKVNVYLLVDAIAAVDEEAGKKAIEEMVSAGAIPITFDDIEWG
jgi:nicotinamidase/pyrazinamidase